MFLKKWYVAVFLCLGACLSGATIDSKSPAQFFLRPEQPAKLEFSFSGSEKELPWTLENWNGKPVGKGKVQPADAKLHLSLKVPAGFYILQIGKTRFGVFCVEKFSEQADPFFRVDAALSWLGKGQYREPLIRILSENGIRYARERIWLGDMVPSAKAYNPVGGRRNYAGLRKLYQKYGVQILEVSHDTPAWLKKDKKSPYPEDLKGYSDSWRKIAGTYANNWCGLEVWNEPDIGFGGTLPAEYYMPLVKAMAYTMADRPGLPLLGGVVTERCPETFRQTCLKSGLLELTDGISLHHYSGGDSIIPFIEKYRKAGFTKSIHITEAASHYPDKGFYQNLPASRKAALDDVIKASNAKAGGAASFYLFVYSSYFEGALSFSMWSRKYAPMPELAAYFTLARQLANRNYQGCYQGQRVFSNSKGDAVVLLRSANPRFLKAKYLGIDGRKINAEEVADALKKDGLVYAKLPFAFLKLQLTDRPKNQVNTRKRAVPSPIILAPNLPLRGTGFMVAKDGIMLEPSSKPFAYQLKVINLSGKAETVKLSVELPWKGTVPAAQKVTVPAYGQTQAVFNLPLPAKPDTDKFYYLTIRGAYDGKTQIFPLVSAINFSAPGLKSGLTGADKIIEIPLSDVSRWKKTFSGNGEWSLYYSPRQTLFCEVKFNKKGEHWLYPEFRVKEQLPDGCQLLMRLSAKADGSSHIYAQVRDRKGRVYLARINKPIDGNWYKASLSASNFGCFYPPSSRGRKLQDFNEISALMIGQSILSGKTASIEISDLLFYTKK